MGDLMKGDISYSFIIFIIIAVILFVILLVWQMGGFSKFGNTLNDVGCNLITTPLGGTC